jgi:hypothetical protein
VYAWPAGGAVKKLIETRAVTNAESPMDPTPNAARALRGKREPNRMSKVALTKGSAGMSHKPSITLSSHFADCVHIERFEPVIDLQEERQSDSHFRGCHRQNEDKHYLAVRLMPSRPGNHECQPSRIEHNLKRHQNKNQITSYEQTRQSQREQDPR